MKCEMLFLEIKLLFIIPSKSEKLIKRRIIIIPYLILFKQIVIPWPAIPDTDRMNDLREDGER